MPLCSRLQFLRDVHLRFGYFTKRLAWKVFGQCMSVLLTTLAVAHLLAVCFVNKMLLETVEAGSREQSKTCLHMR